MKKALFICNTSYQILFVLNYACTITDCSVGIVLTDTLPNMDQLRTKLDESGVFIEVAALRLADVPKLSNYQKVLHYYLQRYGGKNFIENYLNIDQIYDELFFANFNEEVAYIYRYMLRKNSHLKINMFEDGFATYSQYYNETLHELLKPQNAAYKFIRKRIYDNYYAIDKMLVFNPEYMLWRTDCFDIERCEFRDAKDKKFLDLICNVFDVDKKEDLITQRYIYFEESYCADNKEINDIEMVKSIADVVGKNNIYIKTHPRNRINRFANEGFITNKKSSTPWEVLALINGLQDKVLITIASVSVLTPRVLLGLKYRGYMLYKCAEPKESLRSDIIPTYELVRSYFSDDVLAPDSIDLLLEKIREE